MRIVATLSRWALNGASVFCERLVRELRRRGHDAEILVTDPHANVLAPFPQPADIPILRLPVSQGSSIDARKATLQRWLEDRAPSVFLSSGDRQLSGISHGLSANSRTVAMVHNDSPAEYERLWEMAGACDAMVAVGPGIARNIRMKRPEFADRVHTIPHGIPTASSNRESPRTMDGPLRIIYAGRLEQEQKRVFDVLAAVAAGRKAGANLTLTVAGHGTHRGAMEAIAGRLAIPTEFLGTQSSAAMSDLFARSHVCLLPSDYEGFAIAVLEAMAAGCVPVASRIDAGYREFVEHESTGLLAEPRDIKGFAQLLGRLDRDRTMLAQLSARGIAVAADDRYSIPRMAQRYIEVFERVLACPPVRPPRDLHRYRLFGLEVESEIDLGEAPAPAAGAPADITICRGRLPAALEGVHRRGETFECSEDAVLVNTGAAGRFLAGGGRRIVVDAAEGVSDAALRWRLMAAFGAVLQQRGTLMLHGAVVALPAGAIGILGRSGAGKSTLAAGLARRGYAILNDDLCAVHVEEGGVWVEPGSAQLHLWEDSRQALGLNGSPMLAGFSKYEVSAAPASPSRVRLRALIGLDEASFASVTPLDTAGRLSLCLSHTHCREYMTNERAERNFAACVKVARLLPGFRLSRPLDFSAMDGVLNLLDRTAAGLGACAAEREAPVHTTGVPLRGVTGLAV